jgi:hypothetical protein
VLACIQDVVEEVPLSVPVILAPAIVLHGTFDFVLMLLATTQYAYNLSENLLNNVSLGIGEERPYRTPFSILKISEKWGRLAWDDIATPVSKSPELELRAFVAAVSQTLPPRITSRGENQD